MECIEQGQRTRQEESRIRKLIKGERETLIKIPPLPKMSIHSCSASAAMIKMMYYTNLLFKPVKPWLFLNKYTINKVLQRVKHKIQTNPEWLVETI